jgi:hypothetical protein
VYHRTSNSGCLAVVEIHGRRTSAQSVQAERGCMQPLVEFLPAPCRPGQGMYRTTAADSSTRSSAELGGFRSCGHHQGAQVGVSVRWV